jgi:drug/metabolite transporter (DMT)-like permease
VGLGLGPVGAAFFAWDIGVKRGDIKLLGVLSYAAPLISTLLLIAFAQGAASWIVAVACILIVGGALFAARDMVLKKGPV